LFLLILKRKRKKKQQLLKHNYYRENTLKLKTFELGGIHPPENKITSNEPITVLPIPETVTVPLSQHLGAPAQAVVEKGDEVKVGTLIGKSVSFISANIHSPVSGKVKKIDNIIDPSGYKRPAVVITVSGDEWEEDIDRSEGLIADITVEATAIAEKVFNAGIVGMGGACFPTNVKYMPPKGKEIDSLIINGVECEPYLTADHRLMLEKTDEIIVGVQILKKALNLNTAYIGIEANKPDAIKIMTEKCQGKDIEIIPLRVQYPQGAEKQLIKAVTGREVPGGGKLPLDVGCIVNNVGTVYAIYEAIQKNKPLVERVVTITGKELQKPGNYLVRIGTPVEKLIEAAGGLPENTGKIISGGPMMGKAIVSTDVPVAKGSSGIVVMDKSEASRKPVQNCIRCGKCISVCPMGLEPFLLEKAAEREMFDECEGLSITDCMECGSCSFTCPAGRELLDFIRYGKSSVMKIIRERSK
jgi:electron transport complex protein RnfC